MIARMPHLLVLGDSVALGVTEIVSGEIRGLAANNFVDRLRLRFGGWRIDVDAAAHRKTTEAVRLLPALLERDRPDAVLLVLGGSDADINWKRFIVSGGGRVRHNTPAEQFERNLRQLIANTRAAGAMPLLSDLPAHDLAQRGRQMSLATGHDVSAMLVAAGSAEESDRRHEAYAAVIDRVARDTATPVARWAERLMTLPPEQRFGPDALHPGEAAHGVIAEVVGEMLERRFRPAAGVPFAATPS